MVATLVRLRLLVLRNSFRRSTSQLVAVIIGALYGAVGLIVVLGALVGLSFAPAEVATTAVVLAGSAAVLGWAVLPLLLSGVEQTLDPGHLAVYPIAMRPLMIGMLLSGAVGVAGAATTIASLGTALPWLRSPGVAVVALLTGVLGAATCIVVSRAVTSIASGLASGRRFREASGLLVLIPLILAGPIIIGITSGLRSSADALPSVAAGLGWSPLGAVWAVPGAVAAGDPLGALLRLLIAVATFVVLWFVWRWGLERSLVTPTRASARVRAPGKSGLFGILPGTQAGAIAARCLTYWFRDPRYLRQLLVIPLLPAVMLFYSSINHSNGYLFAAGPVVAFALGIGMIADVSYDSTAFALHVSKAVPGRADRWGRAAAMLTFGIPAVAILSLGAAAVEGDWLPAPGLLGLALGMLLSGAAVCSVTSARFVFPVPEPGDNPFRSRPGANISLIGPTFAAWGVIAVLCLPEIVLLVVSLVTREAVWGWLGLAAGVVLGIVLLVVGVRLGGRLLDARAPELLQQLRKDG
ncbi:transporter [Leifsonia virtsii]|uniref:Transporter n=1 Tax=Leifsonia virtsii TaxID=3035915 RepID=A0ABT8IYF3_9MICO|nr:transporter [Leifsonia virtsii]MDN4597849.1 transporter [Leifsonia virtsii]